MKHWTTTLLAVLALTFTAAADTYVKDNNNIALTDPASWVSGSVPGAGDIALWDSTVTGVNNSALGANWEVGQIKITSAGGKVTISGNNTLTLNGVGGVGIDASTSNFDLEINANIALGAAQTWNFVKTTVIGGNLTGSDALTIAGTSDVELKGDNSGFSGNLTFSPASEKVLTLSHLNALGTGNITVMTSNIVFKANVSGLNISNNIHSVGRELKFNTNSRDITLSGNLSSSSAVNLIKTSNAGTLTVSSSNSGVVKKFQTDGGETIVSGSIYNSGEIQLEGAQGTNYSGTLTITGVIDRNVASTKALGVSSTFTIALKDSGYLYTRGNSYLGDAWMNGATANNRFSTLNVNLTNSGSMVYNAWVNVGGRDGMTTNLNLSGSSLFKAAGISLGNGDNTDAYSKVYVNVSVADNASLLSTAALQLGRETSNSETVLLQTGGTVQGTTLRFNADAGNKNRSDNKTAYRLNGGVLNLSGDNNGTVSGNRGDGTSAIDLGKDSVMYLNSGTIRVNGNNNAINGVSAFSGANSGTGRLVMQAGGVTLDTPVTGGDYSFAINVAIEHDTALGGNKDGGLVKTGTGTLLLNAANTYTGDTIVSGGTLILGDNASLLFKLGADGGINKIYNNGGTVTLNGSIDIDVSDYAAGSSWNLFTGGVTLGNAFTVSGAWQNDGTGLWSLGTDWTFDQSSGLLSVAQIPEPSTLTLLLIGAGLLTVSAARRRKCER